jgi:uncharacterized protein (TIGR02145 family)
MQMYTYHRYYVLLVIVLGTFVSCDKNDPPVVSKPTVSTFDAQNISGAEATVSGKVTSKGNAEITAVGVCWGITFLPTIDSNKVVASLADSGFTANITALKAGVVYYARAFAANSSGVGYGNVVSFRTKGDLPTAITENASITGNSAVLNGKVIPNELLTKVTFEYGFTASYGNSVAAVQGDISGGLTVPVTAQITGLQKNTTYHFRVKAENARGTGYGTDNTFKILDPDGTIGAVTDFEGNTYKTIVIGSDVWMMENLKVTRYNDGAQIPYVTGFEWGDLTSPAYCWYGNDKTTYGDIHGGLYNWYAVNTGKLAPQGWHVATNADWNRLIDYLGGANVAGGKMKAISPHWRSPNVGATNSSGFSALGSGARFESGFTDLLDTGLWWTSTSSATPEYAFYRFLRGSSATIDDSFNILNLKNKGFSVRCVKD